MASQQEAAYLRIPITSGLGHSGFVVKIDLSFEVAP
jgi:hypothetical protein